MEGQLLVSNELCHKCYDAHAQGLLSSSDKLVTKRKQKREADQLAAAKEVIATIAAAKEAAERQKRVLYL